MCPYRPRRVPGSALNYKQELKAGEERMEKISAESFADKYKPKPKELVSTKQLTIVEVNKVFETLLPDLATLEFKVWYCKVIYKLRPPKVLELADSARKGNEPRKLFSPYILSQAKIGRGLKIPETW